MAFRGEPADRPQAQEPCGCPSENGGERCPLQGPAEAGIQLRRQHDRVFLHAGRRPGERSHDGLLPASRLISGPRNRHAGRVTLFTPLKIREITLRNRIAVSPMCEYSSDDGFANDWHLVHLGSRAVGGAGLVMVEATAVEARGRITPGDHGIWKDAHIEMLTRIAAFVKKQGAVAGVQIAHAARKASCNVPWVKNGAALTPAEGAWVTVAPSSVPFNDGDPAPAALEKT